MDIPKESDLDKVNGAVPGYHKPNPIVDDFIKEYNGKSTGPAPTPSAKARTPAVSPRHTYDDDVNVSEDPVEGLWRESAIDKISEHTGAERDAIADDYEWYAQYTSGTEDPKKVINYLDSQYKAGDAMLKANFAFNNYLNTEDEKYLEEYYEHMREVPDMPASPSRMAHAAGLVANNAPQLLHTASKGQAFAAVATAGAALTGGIAGIPLASMSYALGSTWAMTSMGMSAAESQKMMAGSFGSELYMDLKEAGIEPDLDTIRNMAIPASVAMAMVEGLQFNTAFANIPGLSKYTRSAIQDVATKALASGKSKLFKRVGNRAISKGARTVAGRMAGVTLENASEEVVQEMIGDIARGLYRWKNAGNQITDEEAKKELLHNGIHITQKTIDTYKSRHDASRIPEQAWDDMVKEYITQAYAGAVVGGVISLPGVTMQGIKAGSREYGVAQKAAEDIIGDIVAETENVEDIAANIKSSDELKKVLGSRKREKLAEAYDQTNRVITKQREQGLSETDPFFWKSPEGEYYNERGIKIEEENLPENAKIEPTTRDEGGRVVDSLGQDYKMEPWKADLYSDLMWSIDEQALVVHKPPDSDKYVDVFGNEYTSPPEDSQVYVWEDYDEEIGIARLEGGQEIFTLVKPWAQESQYVDYTDPASGAKVFVRPTVGPTGKAVIGKALDPKVKLAFIQDTGMELREEQAKALWYEDTKSRRERRAEWNREGQVGEAPGRPPSFEKWLKDNKVRINNEISRRFQMDMVADMRNYRHVRDYAKAFYYGLTEDEKALFGPAVDRLDRIISNLDAGNGEISTMSEAMEQLNNEIEVLRDEIVKARLKSKNATNRRSQNEAFKELSGKRQEFADKMLETRIFEDMMVKTHHYMAAAYYEMQQHEEFLERYAAKAQLGDASLESVMDEMNEKLKVVLDSKRASTKIGDPANEKLSQIFEAYDEEGGSYKEQTDKDPSLGVEMARGEFNWFVGKAKLAGRLDLYRKMNLSKMESSNKRRIRKQMVEKAERIMREVPGTVHMDEADRIENLQKLIDPAFRNEQKLEEKTAEWHRKYENLIKSIRHGDFRDQQGNPDMSKVEDVIDNAIAAAKRPLNRMTLEDLNNTLYAIEMLKMVGKAKLDAKNMAEKVQNDAMIDYAIDSAKNLDMDLVMKSASTKEYKQYMEDKGLSKKYRTALSMILNPGSIFDYLDGGDGLYNGPLHDMFIKNRNTAYGAMTEATQSRKQKIKDAMENMGYKPERFYEDISVGGNTFLVQDVMTFYIARGAEGRAGNNHMFRALIAENGNNLPPGVMDAAIEHLSDSDKKMADIILEDYSKVFPRLEATFKGLNNASLIKENSYIPILREWMKDSADLNDVLFEEMVTDPARKVKGFSDSFSKQRAEAIDAANQRPIRTDVFNVWEQMVEKEERYIHMAELVNQYNKIISDKTFREAIKGTAGNGWLNAIDDYVRSQANPYWWRNQEPLSDVYKWAKRHSTIMYLGYNAQTMLKQIPSIAFFAKEAGLRNVVASGAHYLAHRKQFIQDLKDLDPLYRYRQSEVETVMAKEDVENHAKGRIHKLGENSMKWIQWMDSQVVAIGETAVINKIREDPSYSEADAVMRAQDITQRTQPNADPGTLPRIYKSSEAARLALLFSQQRMKILDMIAYDLPAQVKQKRYIEAMRTFAALQTSMLGIVLASEKRLPEDEEELARWVATYWAGLIPILGSGLVSVIGGYSSRGPFEQLVTDVLGSFKTSDDGLYADKSSKPAINSMLSATGYVFGLPVTPIKSIISAAHNEDPWELIGGQEERDDSMF